MKKLMLTWWTIASLAALPSTVSAVEAQGPAASSLPALSAPESPGSRLMAELIKMMQAGTDAEVLKAYVQGWVTPFSVGADDILRLHDLGAPNEVLTALIRRSAELHAKTVSTLSAPAAAVASPLTLTPDLVTTNPPAVLYPYPEPAAPAGTNVMTVPYPVLTPSPSYSYPAYTYSYLYPYSLYPGYSAYWGSPYFYPYSRFYYPRYYGYGWSYPRYYRYGFGSSGHYHFTPSRPYGGGGGWHGGGAGPRGGGHR